jgi:hypothetical protein
MKDYVSSYFIILWLQNSNKQRSFVSFLLRDSQSSYINNAEAPAFADANNLHFLCIPSHTTHILQPSNKSFFSPSNFDSNKALGAWVKNLPARASTKKMFRNHAEAWE